MEAAVIRWALWAVIVALAVGGKPWRFPRDGEIWLARRADRAQEEGRSRP